MKKKANNLDPPDSESSAIISGATITHPNRIIKSTKTITKGRIAEYYNEISIQMMPYIKNRPIVLFRCTEGETCFYQKHHNKYFPSEIYKIDIKEENGKKSEYLTIKNRKGLLSLIQFSTIEIHLWSAHYPALEKPDFISFDLDPDPKLPWKQVIKLAFLLKEILDQLNLQSFVKTSGGKGLHIIVPLRKKDPWEKTKSFAHQVALYLQHNYPDLITTNPLKSKRKGKIFIDYLRNSRGSLIVAPFSVRAKKDAPISTPISWKELPRITSSVQYNITNIIKRFDQLKNDPWENYFQCKQTLPKFSS